MGLIFETTNLQADSATWQKLWVLETLWKILLKMAHDQKHRNAALMQNGFDCIQLYPWQVITKLSETCSYSHLQPKTR